MLSTGVRISATLRRYGLFINLVNNKLAYRYQTIHSRLSTSLAHWLRLSVLLLSTVWLSACTSNRYLTIEPPQYSTQADSTAALAAKFGGQISYVESNGIQLRLVEAGEGPLVVLVHGWPESWYSWRYQIAALSEAGYHVVAPDMRGYGGSARPENVEDYNIIELTADVAGIVAALGEQSAVVGGHYWGAPIAWNSALL